MCTLAFNGSSLFGRYLVEIFLLAANVGHHIEPPQRHDLDADCFLYTLKRPQQCNIPVFGTSRYQARYSSRALRLASSRSRLKIGLTTLAAPAAARAAAVDAMTAVVMSFPVVLIRWCHVTVVPPSGESASRQEASIHTQSVQFDTFHRC